MSRSAPHRRLGPAVAGGLLAAALVGSSALAVGTTSTGPSTSTAPYMLPVAPNVRTTSILTVGDTIGGYRMVGIPDGLGILGRGSFSLFMNHELGNAAGVVRDHGAMGAFVSDWKVKSHDLTVQSGQDLVQELYLWNGSAYELATGEALNRLCSANLPAQSAFWDQQTRTGYQGRIFMSGEENGPPYGDYGRAFAHILTGAQQGQSYELPFLGTSSWENLVAAPGSGLATVVVGMDDSSPYGQVYIYVGQKQRKGTAIEQAGLVGGTLFGVKVDGMIDETQVREPFGAGVAARDFTLAMVGDGDASGMTGAEIQDRSEASDVTEFLRPEDGSWDPAHPNDYYFVTTNTHPGSGGYSRLWRLRFDDITNPTAGGTIEILLDGTEGQDMMDNITVDATGSNVLIQEDPGNSAHLGAIWSYNIGSGAFTKIAEHDPVLFTGSGNQDEESSGIIDASDVLGPGWFLATVQWHQSAGDPELVEKGQLFALYSPDSDWTR